MMLLTYRWGHMQHLVGRCCEQGPGTLFRHAGRVRHRERSLKERRERYPLACSAVSAGGSHAGPGRRLGRACQRPFPGPPSPGACLPWTPGLMPHHLTPWLLSSVILFCMATAGDVKPWGQQPRLPPTMLPGPPCGTANTPAPLPSRC